MTYDVRADDAPATRESIAFRGLLPIANESSCQGALAKLEARLGSLTGSVLWLHSLRPAPQRYTRWRGAVRWSLDPDGHDAPILLASESSPREEVSAWYTKHVGFDLVVQESRKREVRTLLGNRSRTGYDIDLIDTGEGLSECLPVLTALAMVRHPAERGGPSILAIEEPGAYLHPDLQRALAERICEVAQKASSRIILETHSEHVLLTVQLSVAKGELRPEDVIFYWVRQREDGRSVAEPVELDWLARLRGNWPPGAFQQDIELAGDLQDARDAREAP